MGIPSRCLFPSDSGLITWAIGTITLATHGLGRIGAGRELFGRRKDGSEVPLEIGLNPIHTSEGLLVLASIIDISERKQAELQAQQQRDELEQLRQQRTALLEREVARTHPP